MIVKHGGFKTKPPYVATGPDRPDLLEKFGITMDAAGGKIAFSPWADGKGYNAEAFWPWKYLRVNGQPLKAGETFIYGVEAIWGNVDGTSYSHRLVHNMQDEKVNRIFRARNGWGKAVLSDKGNLGITEGQKELQQQRLKRFVDYDTYGSLPIKYDLPADHDVTITIDDAQGKRVRNFFGQHPRKKGANADLWDGLDDDGKPVEAGKYSVTIVDHEPVKVKVINSVYNAATPPWITESPRKMWGSNHEYPTTVATRGDVTLVGFTGVEGATGLLRVNQYGIVQWTNTNEVLDVTLDDKYAYTLGRDWSGTSDVRRINLTDGLLLPFEDEKRSPKISLPIPDKSLVDESTIALYGGKLIVFVPNQKLFRLSPETGAIEATLDVTDLVAVTERGAVLYGLLSGGKVAVLDADGRATKTLFTASALKNPTRLAVSHDAERFAISDAQSNQVFVFYPRPSVDRLP